MQGAIEEGLGVGLIELEVGDDVVLQHSDGELRKARRGSDGLSMTGDERRMFVMQTDLIT